MSQLMQSFACITECATSVIRTYNLLALLFLLLHLQRKHCVISPCWMNKNDVAKMRQAGTAPATGKTIDRLFNVTYVLCSVLPTHFCE